MRFCERCNTRVPQRVLSIFLIALALAACANPTLPTLAPTETLTIARSTPTSEIIPTLLAAAVPTALATPTAFVTPPPGGQSAIVPILMYHHLADLPSGSSQLRPTWTVAPKNFDAQMNWLVQRGFHTITMGQLVGHLKHGQPLPSKPIIISFDDGWEEDYSVAFPILRRYNFRGTFFIYTNPLDHERFITWAQVQEMSAAGMDIQAHTLSHPHLRALAPDTAMKEIAESKAILEKRLGKPVVALAYPFGEYNNAVIDLVKRAGFESAVTINSGYLQRADELFTLHRIRVSYNDRLQDFAGRLPQ